MRRLPSLTFPVKLDLGCGKNKIDNFIGLDVNDYGQEIVWDFNQGIPLPNDSVLAFHSSHTFEHVGWGELPNLFAEIVRVCKDGTRLVLIVPHADTKEAYYLCHHTRWNEQVIRGIVADHPNLGLVSLGRRGIHFDVTLVVKKVVHRERVTPGQYDDDTEREHVARYKWARRFCEGKTVADIACGTGYGINILRETALSVDGYDKENLGGWCRIIDLEKETWNGVYDVIVSFETLEHLANPEFFLENVAGTCKRAIISTPLDESPGNPHHKQHWSFDQAKALLEQHFACEYFFQQGEEISGMHGPFLIAVGTPKKL